ncbi:MAG TPA: hypothetical protein PLY19_04420 [Rhodoglobus sp.]|nr:hypothetical protein [Rhodoglobus sp.]
MDVMPRALRCVIIAALVVSALVLGAASIHAMTSGSSSMGAMSATTHVMAPADDMSGMHHSATAAATHPTCAAGMCDAGHALLTILCVAGVMALVLLLLLLLPRPGDASRMFRVIEERGSSGALARPRHTPGLTQLSVSRT